MKARFIVALLTSVLLGSTQRASAQHLWWNADGQKDATCVYGQITVYATHSATYFCGINWHPGEPAGGYCGIQDVSPEKGKVSIFSIWDTSKDQHPHVTQADAKAVHSRFGGEGTGAHTHLPWSWELGETFEFYLTKSPGEKAGTTDVRYYVYDRKSKKWLHQSTIQTPNDDAHKEIENISGGGMASFLENWSGQDKTAARLATYRLWIGKGPDSLKPMVHAGGDGKWGELNDTYFLADGSDENLKPVFDKLEKDLGKPTFGKKGEKLEPIKAAPVDPAVVKSLADLPAAPMVDDTDAEKKD